LESPLPPSLLQSLFLALLQGLTEFLPISSSAHLILPSEVFGWPDQGLAFDIAVHLGTLVAVLTYFRRDLARMLTSVLAWRPGPSPASPDAALALWLVVATVPLVFAGMFWIDEVEGSLRSMRVIGWATLAFAILLALADRLRGRRTIFHIGVREALVIGLAQVFAIIPGTSRSGITITAGLMLGLRREAAARFSFLLSIPAILGASTLELAELLTTREPVAWSQLAIGVAVAATSAYTCIHVFLRLVERTGMMPYVIYRLVLGGTLVIVAMAPAMSR
jgi:undecaprenyl-diphosphatase